MEAAFWGSLSCESTQDTQTIEFLKGQPKLGWIIQCWHQMYMKTTCMRLLVWSHFEGTVMVVPLDWIARFSLKVHPMKQPDKMHGTELINTNLKQNQLTVFRRRHQLTCQGSPYCLNLMFSSQTCCLVKLVSGISSQWPPSPDPHILWASRVNPG